MIDGKHVGGTDDPEEFQIFRDKGITGWDHAIQSMGKVRFLYLSLVLYALHSP